MKKPAGGSFEHQDLTQAKVKKGSGESLISWGTKEEYFKERIGLPQTAVSLRSAVYAGRMNTEELGP